MLGLESLKNQQNELARLRQENAELERKFRELENQQGSQSQQQKRSANASSGEQSDVVQRLAAQLQEMESRLVAQKKLFESKAREIKEIKEQLTTFYSAIEVLPGADRGADQLSNKISELISFKEELENRVKNLGLEKNNLEQDLIALKGQVATASSSFSDIEGAISSLQTYDSATLENIADREAQLEINEEELKERLAIWKVL